MTSTTTAPRTATTSLSPTARQVWNRSRGLLIATVILLVGALAIAVLRSGEQHGALDPRSADRQGTRAVAELLAQRGVDTTVVTTTAEAARSTAPDTTLLVARPDLLNGRQLEVLRAATASGGGRTVLLAPGATSVSALAPSVETQARTAPRTIAPQCSAAYARRAGEADLGGLRYRPTEGAAGIDSCYPVDGAPTLLRLPNGDGDTVITGSADFLHNATLDEQGNASLALQLLGTREHLVWYLPSPTDPAAEASGDESMADLLPPGWLWGAVQLFLAAVFAALWRARRLGPLVPERLPVSVPAAETTEGRARLYRLADARDSAAAALRAAARERVAPLLGVPAADAHAPEALVPAVARHTGDLSTTHSLFFGPVPPDDAALVRLADDLDELERRITPSPTPAPTDKDRTS
ncbi:DUF4350 domain-containing protein [Streptomyces chumphonensis]|uniref:DUF4350 domain-containing protein n=1 Tax=Streptomyces chumphonensis TaxID=1214925 RepID=A0A927IBK5_9ACTN|nr:DUF4350 domain-containing protein [Streptomyces chumphonensis]MBD3930975.1 DUF4350 domain-containing protein [Streptomyces chumphonensis]